MRVRFSDHWEFGFERGGPDFGDAVRVTVGWWSLMYHPGWFEVSRHTPERRWAVLRAGYGRWSATFHDRPGPNGLERAQRVGARTPRRLVGGVLRAPWMS